MELKVTLEIPQSQYSAGQKEEKKKCSLKSNLKDLLYSTTEPFGFFVNTKST